MLATVSRTENRKKPSRFGRLRQTCCVSNRGWVLGQRPRLKATRGRHTGNHRRARLPASFVMPASLLVLAVSAMARAQSPIRLVDFTNQTGIDFVHYDGATGQRYIVEPMSAGLAIFDYDGDGDQDLYFLSGSTQPPTAPNGRPSSNRLYRNDGNFHFTDVTLQAGVGDPGHGMGVAVGDVDNDGYLDMYVNNFGPNVLYLNNGDGTFRDATAAAGVACGNKVGAGCCFLDMDGDGDLDLYVANYVRFSYESHVPKFLLGRPVYPSPLQYIGEPDVLYENLGDGHFADVSEAAGISRLAGTGMGTVCGDYDNDGDTDVYVCNDEMGNYLWKNDGTGKFTEVGVLSGAAYDSLGHPQGSMGADFGDYDNDGWLDLIVTSYAGEMKVLYQNLRGGMFNEVARQTGVGAVSLPHVSWGVGFVDFDNDGYRDIYMALGDLDEIVAQGNNATAYELPNLLLRNNGQGKFIDVSKQSGDGMQVVRSSRGAAFDDLDGDGRIDVVVQNSRRAPTVLRNESSAPNHWLGIRLVGTKSNRDGVGARVKVTAGGQEYIDEVHSGRGYQSHFGMQLHFGLGEKDQVERVEVHWIGGGIDLAENVPVDCRITVRQGAGLIGGSPDMAR